MINTAFVPKYSTAKIATSNEQVLSLFTQFLSIFGIFVILILGRIPDIPRSTLCSSTSLLNNHGIFADAPEPWQYGFQDPATPVMEGIVDLHHDICFFLILIIVFVLWMLSRTVFYFVDGHGGAPANPEKIIHGTTIEIAWTIAPSIILVLIAIPSFALLYSLDEIVDPAITIKAIGHQWYWSYEYSDYTGPDSQNIAFDSYMVPEEDLELGQLRLLEVDQRVVVPVNTHIRVIVTAADVLHSWALPSCGTKIDAVPGRLNQVSMFIRREGVFYGQCSEICGANHAFMPIVVEAVPLDNYTQWIANKIAN
ncbi:cytochrome c oxidase subunit 2 (mitochondrion) [Bryopsis sp. KO-2023]|nr:cytochrome c oxidase subunit 2 [Bryopsis sp. KO-2023]